MLSPSGAYVLAHPAEFVLRVLKGFKNNQGLLLAGAVAYYALLSVVPLLILTVIVLSNWMDQEELLSTLGRYLEWLVPGQSTAVVNELANFVHNQSVVGWVLLGTMLFFSSLAFSVLEKAMAVIFLHRFAVRHRRFLVSALLPYCYIFALGFGLMIVTFVSGGIQAMAQDSIHFLGWEWSLSGVSGVLLYLLGFAGEIVLITSIYMVMPVGRLWWRHALVGGVTAAVLWEITRRVLVWYFSTLSKVSEVYGSLTTAIVVLFSLEIGATLLLFGAQVISDYEQVGRLTSEPSGSRRRDGSLRH
ncbi:YihY/virulence factor BrkB family protein [Ramlibacter sp. G-1-2-2]|uniref:YihY/virulence factor BrkB family protein n=2 Tax=Ramlibacter agri TaxID=2728837 RepID=A0A848HC55_9BURK|nr:YihY/virulence factor BrkB family protein [Ramlibacter agri]NML46093.1 YihY/virulence factor BrkB family protein [Ramlibacter agri]